MLKKLIILGILFSQALSAQQAISVKFSFGQKIVQGYRRVDPSDQYSEERGYGFDFGTVPVSVDQGGTNDVTSGHATSDKPFFFSVALPEGNYNIKVITGNITESTVTTIRAESRRLLFERVKTEPGKFATLSATINIRVPEIRGTTEMVQKKPREQFKLDWDNKMTFEFNDEKPCICALEITKTEEAVTVYLAGNSTVVDQDDDP